MCIRPDWMIDLPYSWPWVDLLSLQNLELLKVHLELGGERMRNPKISRIRNENVKF